MDIVIWKKVFKITLIEGALVLIMIYVLGILFAPINFNFYSGVALATIGAFMYDVLRRIGEAFGN